MIIDSVPPCVYYEIFLASSVMNRTIIVDNLYYTMKGCQCMGLCFHVLSLGVLSDISCIMPSILYTTSGQWTSGQYPMLGILYLTSGRAWGGGVHKLSCLGGERRGMIYTILSRDIL